MLNRRSFLASAGAAFVPRQSQVNNNTPAVEKDVVFGKGGGVDLHCDIYRPPASVAFKRTADGNTSRGLHG